jgi:hypothetical protein
MGLGGGGCGVGVGDFTRWVSLGLGSDGGCGVGVVVMKLVIRRVARTSPFRLFSYYLLP